jgi:DNA-binding SARP family transcriptional activator
MKLNINTLGEFDIKINNQSILKESSRTYRLYKLFEYFLTFRNKKLLPEAIIDNILSDSESDDPKNVLRTQIFRLRKTIKGFLPSDMDESKYMTINFINGYYFLEIGENTIIDVDEFENLIRQADLEREYNIEASANLYQKALKLYKGLYLSDNSYEVWLVPARNYYQRLYLKTLYKLIDILKENNENEKIITLCEESFLIEPYEENIHINLMEAMLAQGQQKNALNHYEYSLNLIKKELDTKPSNNFTEMLDKIQNYSARDVHADIDSLERDLEDRNLLGAMQCNIESFKFLFNLQKRKSFRNDENDYLCIININWNQDRNSRELSELLRNSLRKGDVFTFWNKSQILVMLHNVRDEGIKKIENRIYNNLRNYTKLNSNDINMIFQPLVSEKSMM